MRERYRAYIIRMKSRISAAPVKTCDTFDNLADCLSTLNRLQISLGEVAKFWWIKVDEDGRLLESHYKCTIEDIDD